MFKIHDIRGEYGKDITPQKFAVLGSAANLFGKEIVIGMDYRPHNRELSNAFCSGFEGEKTSIGNAPSPATAFLSRKLGLSLTASHNPPQYAGAKFFRKRTYLTEEEMAALKKRFEETRTKPAKEAPASEEPALIDEYVNALPEFKGGVFDLCGGAACAVKEIFPNAIFSDPDPLFQRHSAEPKDDTLAVLKEKTLAGVVGFAFDGDADRVIACDAGIVLEGDVVAAFIASGVLKKGEKVVLSIDCRQEVFDYLAGSGFSVITSKVGDTAVVGTAVKEGAAFSAERSGHYSFLSHAPNSDGIYAAAALSGTRAGELAAFNKRFRNVTLIEPTFVKIDFQKLRALIEDKEPRELVTLDGVKAVFDDYALLVRASTTEPKIRINSEAKNAELAGKGMALAQELVKKCMVR